MTGRNDKGPLRWLHNTMRNLGQVVHLLHNLAQVVRRSAHRSWHVRCKVLSQSKSNRANSPSLTWFVNTPHPC